MADLKKLLTPGLLGRYTHFEATEIFVSRGKGQAPENVFTVLVVEDRRDEAAQQPNYLSKPINLKPLGGWTFGVKRYTSPITALEQEISTLEQNGIWKGSGEELRFGKLTAIPSQFVAPDSSTVIPFNRVLKNNFWNGCHVLEWSDRDKKHLEALFAEAPLIQELSEKIEKVIPINLAGFSDRLGNLIVQLPVTALLTKFVPRRDGICTVKSAWRADCMARAVRATTFSEFDGVIRAFASASIQGPETLLAGAAGRGTQHGFVWDDANDVLLAVSGPTNFIETIGLNMHAVDGEPRTLSFTQADGTVRTERIGVQNAANLSVIGDGDGDETGGKTRNRLYRERESALASQRVFVQYKPQDSTPASERARALSDLRTLIRRHGQVGAWLWDPYLGAYDVLDTLFYASTSGADLRALTEAKEPPDSEAVSPASPVTTQGGHGGKSPTRAERFVQKQRAILAGVQSNWRGFRLEFRARLGQAGWGFHDRFLILPQHDGAALAWSLGTSVNSLGTEHHILQQVDDGQLIANAFVDLWDKLSAPEHLIWKKP
jgi:hypothetical protein